MTSVNRNTIKGKNFIAGYRAATATTLADVYKSYSSRKARAEMACRQIMKEENGFDFRIISNSSHFFSCGWTTPGGAIRIETGRNSYTIA